MFTTAGQKQTHFISLCCKFPTAFVFGCSIDAAAQQQMVLNFVLVVSDQLFSVVLAAYKRSKIRAPVVWPQYM